MEMKALIVDSDPKARFLLRPILELMGFDCIEANGRREALIALTENTIDFLVTGLDMASPDEGFKIIHDAKAIFGTGIYILVVSKTSIEEHIHAEIAGANATLNKPFNPADVLRAAGSVKRVLEKVEA